MDLRKAMAKLPLSPAADHLRKHTARSRGKGVVYEWDRELHQYDGDEFADGDECGEVGC